MKTYKVTVDDLGTIRWYNEKGKLHREDGPAIEWADGSKEWFLKGRIHREDGPAIEWANGYKAWYLNDKMLTEQEWKAQTQKHTIVIDGKSIQLSNESYKVLQKSLLTN